ncbi:MAG: glycosyltransferase family 4 protein [Desulfobacterales bacterium]|jgi:glycosyltransferase involved in cell wall biosynthesis|nr:glycosyltransferase family 4 protein [Desulfobacterales bacterium]
MRILVFTQQLAEFRSGVGTYARSLVTGLQAAGHRVTAVTARNEAAVIPGVRVVGLPRPGFDPSPGGWLGLGIGFARYLSRHAQAADIAHFTDAREGFAVRRCRIPVTGTANDAYALEWRETGYPRTLFHDRLLRAGYYRLLRCIEGPTYRRLDGVVANSRHVAVRIASGYGLAAEALRVIPYGLPPQTPAEATALAGGPALLFVGGNFARKGLGPLLEALVRLRPSRPAIHLHVVGGDANQRIFEQQADRLGVRDNVTFHGRRPNAAVRSMMAGAAIFVLPSLTEGFGLVYLEAMQAGVPVIATRAGGAHEVFAENKEAIFVSPGSAAELAAAVERIARDRGLAETLRAGGRAAAARFSVQAMTARTVEFWHELELR